MVSGVCLCKYGKKSFFTEYLRYKGETVFKNYEGIVIGKCIKCGLLKTFYPKKNNLFDPKQSRSDFYESNREQFTELFRPVVELIKKYKSHGSVLDVGCSSGILLALLKKENYKVKGIEPNKEAFKIAQKKLGEDVFYGTSQDFIRINKEDFDVIIYNHVLEHIEDSRREITLVTSMLNKNGILMIGVPNTNNFIFYLRKKYWESLMPKEHIWHFSAKYLINFLLKFNLRLISKTFFDHERKDYPVVKRIYFKTLTLMNKIFNTGEAVLLIFKPSFKI